MARLSIPGKFQLERYKAIHLRETPSLDPIPGAPRVDAENFALRAIAQPGTSISILCPKLFASSLCDDGPDLDSQPSKLWASREEFQAVASANIGDVGIPDINDLVDAVGRISIVDSGMPSWRESKADRILDSIEAWIPSAQQRTFESASVDSLQPVRSMEGKSI
ncbi:hypothetical protein EV401DRAFT_1895177 [Pisolithus croceorrhizus]|nr:hypothetical protein EV401DRAFT_1895177 [Pisolithus croceorrhizus]